MPDTKYLQKRRQGWYVRVAVPPAIQTKAGKAHIIKSLQTRDLKTAQQRRWAAIAEIKGQLEALRGRRDGWVPMGISLDTYARDTRNWYQDIAKSPSKNLRAEPDEPTNLQQAKLVVSEIAEEIEEDSRKRRRRGLKQKQHIEAIGKVLGDLLVAASRDPKRWSARGTTPRLFTGLAVSHRSYKAIRGALLALELIEEHPGYFDRGEGWNVGRSTRARATQGLLQFAVGAGINLAEAEKHFPASLPIRPLVLKAASKRLRGRKAPGYEMRFAETPKTKEMVSEIRELDSFIAEHKLEGGIHRGYRRVFNQGDQAGFRWNKGGRLYSTDDDNYQILKKEQRLEMLIDGQHVVEIDIAASFLTIVYARLGMHLDLTRDPYEIPDLPREVVKAWVNPPTYIH